MAPLEGPVGIGALVNAVLLGCLIVQSCVYFKNPRGDTWLMKVFVLLILVLLHSHLGCTIVWLWAITEEATGSGSFPHYATTLLGVSNVCGAVILFLERCFFSHRILRASDNHLLAFTFFIFCIFSFTAALGAATVFFANGTAYLIRQLSNGWIFPLVIISGLVCDLAINVVTGFYLRSQRSMGVVSALSRVTRLLSWIAETGTLTSIFSVAVVIIYWLTRANFAWIGLIVCMPGVSANAILAALNAQGNLRPEIEHQRVFKIGEHLIADRAKRPPILIAISKQVDRRSEKSPV